MKIDRLGPANEIPQNENSNQIPGKVNENAEGISKTPDSVESFSENRNPFDKDSIFHNQEHQPQGRPFTDASFRPEHAKGRPFQDKVVTTEEEVVPEEQVAEETPATPPEEDLPENEEV